jgi:hypothetical protein
MAYRPRPRPRRSAPGPAGPSWSPPRCAGRVQPGTHPRAHELFVSDAKHRAHTAEGGGGHLRAARGERHRRKRPRGGGERGAVEGAAHARRKRLPSNPWHGQHCLCTHGRISHLLHRAKSACIKCSRTRRYSSGPGWSGISVRVVEVTCAEAKHPSRARPAAVTSARIALKRGCGSSSSSKDGTLHPVVKWIA